MTEAAIGLGSNLGDRAATIAAALGLLDGAGVRVTARSSLYETAPWGDADQGPFLNACALVETALSPHALLARCLGIERALGRARDKARRWGPRVIDLDILFFGDLTLTQDGLAIPHPRLFERAFVLTPLAEIAGDRVIAGRRVADAAEAIGREGVTRYPA